MKKGVTRMTLELLDPAQSRRAIPDASKAAALDAPQQPPSQKNASQNPCPVAASVIL